MPKSFKLAILRARNDPAYPYIPDPACIEMIMTGDQSVLRYWSDTTHNYFDFSESSLMPWVDFAPGATDRKAQVGAAIAALRAANPGFDPIAGFDGVLLFTHPGGTTSGGAFKGWDGGSGKLDDGRGYSVIPVIPSTGVFMYHELGHTLGFDHSYGLDNNGTDWNPNDADIIVGPEYGSPQDIMSAETFGSRWEGAGPTYSGNPTFRGPAVVGWPSDAARSRGPHLARASLIRWHPEAMVNHVVDQPFPTPGQRGLARVRPPEAKAGTTLLILHPPGEPASGVGRVFVEYRPYRGWDVGLKLPGDDVAQAGLVIHTLETISTGDVRPWYRGCVPLAGPDRDFQLPGSNLVITLEGYRNDASGEGFECWADVAFSLGVDRTLTLKQDRTFEEPVFTSQPISGTTPCGTPTSKITYSTQTLTFFDVATSGFGGTTAPATPPVIAWRVAGTPVNGTSGTVDVPIDGGTISLDFTIDPASFELGLQSPGGIAVSALVEVAATEAGGGAAASAQTQFVARGWYDEYTPESLAAIAACVSRVADTVEAARALRPNAMQLLFDRVEIGRFVDQIRSDRVILHPRIQMKLKSLEMLSEDRHQT